MSDNQSKVTPDVGAEMLFLKGLMGDGIEQAPEEQIEVGEALQDASQAAQFILLAPGRITPEMLRHSAQNGSLKIEPFPDIPGLDTKGWFADSGRIAPSAEKIEQVKNGPSQSAPNGSEETSDPAAAAKMKMADLAEMNSTESNQEAPEEAAAMLHALEQQGLTRAQNGEPELARQGAGRQKIGDTIGDTIGNTIGGVIGGVVNGAGIAASETLKQGFKLWDSASSEVKARRANKIKTQLNDPGEVDTPKYGDIANNIAAKVEERNEVIPEEIANKKVESILEDRRSMFDKQFTEVSRLLEIPHDQLQDSEKVRDALESINPATLEQIKEIEAGYLNDLKSVEEAITDELSNDPAFQALSEDDQAKYLKTMMDSLDATKALTEEQARSMDALNKHGLLTGVGAFVKDMFKGAKDLFGQMLERLGTKQAMSDDAKVGPSTAPGAN